MVICRRFNICKMPVEKVDIETFLSLATRYPVLDARSPGEFEHAHLPGAVSFPLFTDEERKVVGTAYKQQGREEAIKMGMEYFGVKMRRMVEEAESIAGNFKRGGHQKNLAAGDEQISAPLTGQKPAFLVHCWRGGMRSAAVAWMLNIYGFEVYLLEGGYKKFRSYVLETFAMPFKINILGGFTGSGKTELLHELSRKGLPVIDLEHLANHKGSAFGAVGPQASQEMFENELALALRSGGISPRPESFNTDGYAPREVWIEDESQRIGTLMIPNELWKTMQRAPVYFLEIPFERRLDRIEKEYGVRKKEDLDNSIVRIQKRLGGLEVKTARSFLEQNNTREAFSILLMYYDRCYLKSLKQKQSAGVQVCTLPCHKTDIKENSATLLACFPALKVTP